MAAKVTWSTMVLLTPGVPPTAPILGTRNLAVIPIDQSGNQARLRDDILRQLGFTSDDRAASLAGLKGPALQPPVLLGPLTQGFQVVPRASSGGMLAFLVTFGTSDVRATIRSNLIALLHHIATLTPRPERIWVPLMGIEGADLTRTASLGLILDAIAEAGAASWPEQRFVIACGEDIAPDALASLRIQIEETAGRDVLDLAEAVERVVIKPDRDALAVLETAARLMWNLRPHFNNGRVSTRLILFALINTASAGMAPARALQRALETIAPQRDPRRVTEHYLNVQNVPDPPVRSPVVFSSDAVDLLRQAESLAGAEPLGVAEIALALLDQAQRKPPNETSARRALERSAVDAAALQAAFKEALAKLGPKDSTAGPAMPLKPAAERKDFYTSPFGDVPDIRRDALKGRAEAVALARIAALRDTPAPLAIGIFGDWGAGKTSCMETIHDIVEQLEGSEPYHEKIVQVRFNAWHYIETNLWASLVSHVFAELDRTLRADQGIGNSVDVLHGGLATVRRSEAEAAGRVVAARTRLDQALAASPAPAGPDFMALASETFRVFYEHLDDSDRAKIAAGVADLGVAQGGEAWQRAEKAAREAQSLANRAWLVWRELRRAWGEGNSAPIVWAAAALGALLLAALFGRVIASWLGDALGFFSGVGTFALTAAVALSKLPHAAGGVVGLFEQLDARRRQAADIALAAVEKEVAAAQAALAEAVTEFRAATPLGRLTRFIRDKAADAAYAKHLGLVAMIRKDFELLSACIVEAQSIATAGTGVDPEEQSVLRQARKIATTLGGTVPTPGQAAPAGPTDPDPAKLDEGLKPYGRIILYIDDLDRCTTDKVVEVLQAVHLLLAFKLFVVFVAVDYRWVRAALEKAYSGQLRAPPLRRAAQAASAADYLEKIFQIPYWVRRLDTNTSKDYLRALIGEAKTKTLVMRPIRQVAAAPPLSEPHAGRPTEAAREKTPSTQAAPPESPINASRPAPDAPQGHTSSQPVPLEPIEITDDEQALMATLAPYAGRTPRQLKRFFNIYRVVKASSSGEKFAWQAVLALLAITTRAPARFADLVGALDIGRDMNQLRAALENLGFAGTEDGRACLSVLDAVTAEVTPADLAGQVRIVARFSFCEQDWLGMTCPPAPAPMPDAA
ncbi:MAG TPA: P-loop NTPase fold protein [Acetobacteraceae bacterium]|nr:P-loop NTPase fold protein [Acetobacteraceae bacterium]